LPLRCLCESGSVVNDAGKPFQFRFGFRIQIRGHFVYLIFLLATGAAEPDLPTPPLHLQRFTAFFAFHVC
jgi:hypothetical protein